MLKYFRLSLRKRWSLYIVLISILSLLSIGYLGAVKITETRDLMIRSSLEDHWRFEYDLLVLPKNGYSYSEQRENYLPPNRSIMNYGGISLEDVEGINAIPGVEIAAPIANLGYVYYHNLDFLFTPEKETAYKITTQYKEFNGLDWELQPKAEDWVFYEKMADGDNGIEYDESNYSERSNFLAKMINEDGRKRFDDEGRIVKGLYPQMIQIIAVDFDKEKELYEMNDLKVGMGEKSFEEHLLTNDNFKPNYSSDLLSEGLHIPSLLLNKVHDAVDFQIEIEAYDLPTDLETLTKEKQNFHQYMENSVPKKQIASYSINPRSPYFKYRTLGIFVDRDEVRQEGVLPVTNLQFHKAEPTSYEEMKNVLNPTIPMFKLARNSIALAEYDEGYKDSVHFQVKANYDPTRIQPKYLEAFEAGDFVEVWNPLRPRIVEDGEGNAYQDKWLAPTGFGLAYFPQSPDMIVSLESALELKPKTKLPISSVRVVVSDVASRSMENQEKVQNIAREIQRKTGHQVEILTGSTAAKVDVVLPKAEKNQPKKIEEAWQKIGFSWDIQRTMNRSNLFLFSYLLFLSFVFIYTVATHSLLKRSMDFAILRSFGWRRNRIVTYLLIEVTLMALLSMIPFVLVNQVLHLTPKYQAIILFFIYFLVLSVSYYAGTRKSLRQPPKRALMGEVNDGQFARLIKIRSTMSFALNQVFRRPARFLLFAIVIGLTSFMLIVIMTTQQNLQNELGLSFMGDALAVDLDIVQSLYIALGILLTSSIIFLFIFLNLSERQMEFYTLTAIGWTGAKIRSYLLKEAIIIAMIGGILGGVAAILLLLKAPTIQIVWWIVLLIISLPIVQQILFTFVVYRMIKRKLNTKTHLQL